MTDFPQVGEQFGAFLITGVIGRGGMGVVFSAVQRPFNRPVALKVLDPRFSHDESFVARFIREGEVLAAVNSPHIIQVFDHGRIGDCLYLAMQHVGGGDLSAHLRQHGPLTPALAADLTAQVASALADAHRLGVIHRDIKPSNVLLARTGEDLFAYLCDFGIAQSAPSDLTLTGMLPGTPNFTAPERHAGHAADVRSDLYALGCLWWCLLTGRGPYAGTEFQIAEQHCTAPVPAVPVHGPLELATNQLLARLMAKEPAERPASAVEVVAALRGIQRIAEEQRAPALPAVPATPVSPATPTAAPRDVPTAAPTLTRAVMPPHPGRPVAPPPVAAASVTRERGRTRRLRTALTAVGIVLAAALLGGGGLLALSSALSPVSPVDPSPAPAASPTRADSLSPEASAAAAASLTRQPVRKVTKEVEVGSNPHGLVVNPGSRLAFVANYGDSSVSVINIDSDTVVRKIDVGKNPQSVAVDPASGLLLVGCDGIPAVQIYDLQGYNLVGSVSTGDGPIRVAVHSSQKVAYAVAQGSSSMQVIDLDSHKLIRTVDVGAKPRVIEVDEQDQIAYIGHWDSSVVSVIDLRAQSKISELEVGRDPNSISVAPDARLAFVASYGDGRDGGGTVTVLDLDRRAVRTTIDVDAGPSRLTVDEPAGVVYLTCLYAQKVDVINLGTLTVSDRFSTAKRPTGAGTDSTTGKLYVTSFDDDVVQVFAS